MSKLHPAAKIASKMLRKLGVNFYGDTALGFKVIGQDYRPVYVDLKPSQYEDRAKIEISSLYSEFDAYDQVKHLNGIVIDF